MNRRVLEERINSDVPLATLGVDANLIYDRIITITDDAGLAPGEPFIIKAKCFPFMEEMTVERITAGIRSLAERNLIGTRSWVGRTIISVNPEAFQAIQRLRRDYVRRFEFGELSQLTYSQGLHGFRSATERHQNGIRPESVRTSSTSDSTSTSTSTSKPPQSPKGEVLFDDGNVMVVSSEPAKSNPDKKAVEEIYDAYPRHVGRNAAIKAIEKVLRSGRSADEILERVKKYAAQRAGEDPKFTPHPATWFNRGSYDDEDARPQQPQEEFYRIDQ